MTCDITDKIFLLCTVYCVEFAYVVEWTDNVIMSYRARATTRVGIYDVVDTVRPAVMHLCIMAYPFHTPLVVTRMSTTALCALLERYIDIRSKYISYI
jgi:hypothetical protein